MNKRVHVSSADLSGDAISFQKNCGNLTTTGLLHLAPWPVAATLVQYREEHGGASVAKKLDKHRQRSKSAGAKPDPVHILSTSLQGM